MAFIDFLDVVTPDYSDVYLTKSANFDIPTPGAYKQVINETDGGSFKVVTMKDTPDATVTLKFTGVTQADADILSDFYYNPAKAYGMARSYVWEHPQTLSHYTVQNISGYSETATVMSYGRYDISFTAKILGVHGLSVTTTGSTIDFSYGGAAIFKTLYSDGTYSLLINPPLKDFGSSATRNTIITVDDMSLVTTLSLRNNAVTDITTLKYYDLLEILFLYSTSLTIAPDVTSNLALEKLYLYTTNITAPPDVTNNIALTHLYLNNTSITASPDVTNNIALTHLYLGNTGVSSSPDISNNIALAEFSLYNTTITIAPDVTNNIALNTFILNDNDITNASLSSCVDKLYANRVEIGGESCAIDISGNNGLTADAIAKIEGTGVYISDGLIDNGCTVTY